MAELTAKNTYDLELIILDHLQGTPVDVTRVRLQSLCSQLKTSCRSLYQSIQLEAIPRAEIDEEVQAEAGNENAGENGVAQDEVPQDVSAGGNDEEALEEDTHEDNIEALNENTHQESFQTIRLTKSILASLNIKKSTDSSIEGTYEKALKKSNNLYDLIKILSDDGYGQMEYLLEELIKTIKPRRNWPLIYLVSAGVSAVVGGLTYAFRQPLAVLWQWLSSTFPLAMNWVGRTFSILRNIPLLGIIGNGLILTWDWYNTLAYGTNIPSRKLYNLLFKTLATGLTISAYTLSFLAAGIITIPAAILFVLGSTTKVFKGGYNWWRSARPVKPDNIEAAEWEVLAQYEREANLHQRSKYSALANIGAAVLTTIAVGIWNFSPPGLIVTIFCVSFISLITLAEWTLLSNINESSAYRLQTSIEKIENPKSTLVRPANQNEASRQQARHELLNAQADHIRLREEAVTNLEREVAARAAQQEEDIQGLLQDVTALHGTSAGVASSTGLILQRLQNLHRRPEVAPANDEDIEGAEVAAADPTLAILEDAPVDAGERSASPSH